MLPILMVIFGSMMLLSAACQNWSGFMATRWFLGVSVSNSVIEVVVIPDFTPKEGPFLPLAVHYLTTFYRREKERDLYFPWLQVHITGPRHHLTSSLTFYRRGELARQLAIFYAAPNIVSAISGLLSYGIFQITTGSLKAWRYLFIIEGSLTLVSSSEMSQSGSSTATYQFPTSTFLAQSIPAPF